MCRTPLKSRGRRGLGAVALAATLLSAGPARADDAASAQALFTDAKKLMAAGKYGDACPKLEESQRLSPGTGTKFNLADCYEHTGKLASAWAAFLSVAAAAKNANQGAREKAARDRATALEPKLSRMAVVVPDATRAAGLEVKRDDTVVGDAEWGEAMPIDPGEHTVVATAPGKRSWKGIVEVEGGGSTAKIIVPPLDDAPAPVVAAAPADAPTLAASPAPTAPPPAADSSSNKVLGWVLVGTGAVAVGAGTAFWVARGSVESRLDMECGPNRAQCPPGASNDIANGKTDTAMGVGLFALGGAAVVAGTVVLVVSGHKAKPTAAFAPLVLPRGGGVGVSGAF